MIIIISSKNALILKSKLSSFYLLIASGLFANFIPCTMFISTLSIRSPLDAALKLDTTGHIRAVPSTTRDEVVILYSCIRVEI